MARDGDELDVRRQSHIARLNGEFDRRRACRGARCANWLCGLSESWSAGDATHGEFGNRGVDCRRASALILLALGRRWMTTIATHDDAPDDDEHADGQQ